MNKILIILLLLFSTSSFSSEVNLIYQELNLKKEKTITIADLFKFAKQRNPKLTPEKFRNIYLQSIVKNKFNFTVFKSKLK